MQKKEHNALDTFKARVNLRKLKGESIAFISFAARFTTEICNFIPHFYHSIKEAPHKNLSTLNN